MIAGQVVEILRLIVSPSLRLQGFSLKVVGVLGFGFNV